MYDPKLNFGMQDAAVLTINASVVRWLQTIKIDGVGEKKGDGSQDTR